MTSKSIRLIRYLYNFRPPGAGVWPGAGVLFAAWLLGGMLGACRDTPDQPPGAIPPAIQQLNNEAQLDGYWQAADSQALHWVNALEPTAGGVLHLNFTTQRLHMGPEGPAAANWSVPDSGLLVVSWLEFPEVDTWRFEQRGLDTLRLQPEASDTLDVLEFQRRSDLSGDYQTPTVGADQQAGPAGKPAAFR